MKLIWQKIDVIFLRDTHCRQYCERNIQIAIKNGDALIGIIFEVLF
jgi:hypothetical protein